MSLLTKTPPAPRIFTRGYYHRLSDLEEHSGWYQGMCEVAVRLGARYSFSSGGVRVLDAGGGTGRLLGQVGRLAGAGGMCGGIELGPGGVEVIRRGEACPV